MNRQYGCGRDSHTLHVVSISEMALRPTLAATITSSWKQLLPAATALAVANVMGFVTRTKSSGVYLTRGTSGESNAYKSERDENKKSRMTFETD